MITLNYELYTLARQKNSLLEKMYNEAYDQIPATLQSSRELQDVAVDAVKARIEVARSLVQEAEVNPSNSSYADLYDFPAVEYVAVCNNIDALVTVN
jgi:hypothetical protein